MSSGRITWLVVLIFSLILFFFIIPVHIYNYHWIIFSLLGGVVLGGCIFMLIGDFSSAYDLFSEPEPGDIIPPERRLAPFAVIPAIVLAIVLIVHHSSRKEKELAEYSVLTKGSITSGESTTTKRRFSSNTSYTVKVVYEDSAHRKYTIEQSVGSSEFHNTYNGAIVDVVYSRKHPSLAKAFFNLNDLSQYKNIPLGQITVVHLTKILEGEVKEDSVLTYLNSINYEWSKGAEKGYYTNEKLKLAIKLFPNNEEIAFLQKRNSFVVNKSEGFEKNITKEGFKKMASNVNGVFKELYYNDQYVVSKETQMGRSRGTYQASLDGFEIFHLARMNK